MDFSDLSVKNKYAIYCLNQGVYNDLGELGELDELDHGWFKLDDDNDLVNPESTLQFVLTDTGKLVTLDKVKKLISKGYKIVYPILNDKGILNIFSFIPLTYEKYSKLYNCLYSLIDTNYSHNIIRVTSVDEFRSIILMIMDISKDKNTGMKPDIIKRMFDKLNNGEAIYIHIDNLDEYTDITDVSIYEVDLDGTNRSDYKLYKVIV